MTKICFVCRTESLRQMDFLFVALSHCDKQNWCMLHKKGQNVSIFFAKYKIGIKNIENAQKVPKRAKSTLLALFGIFLGKASIENPSSFYY